MIKHKILNITRGVTTITVLASTILGGSYGIGDMYAKAWDTAERAHSVAQESVKDASHAIMADAKNIETQIADIEAAIEDARANKKAGDTPATVAAIEDAEAAIEQASIIIQQQLTYASRAKAETTREVKDSDPYWLWEQNTAAAAYEQTARFTADVHNTMLDRAAPLELDSIPARIGDVVASEQERIEEEERKAKEEAERKKREEEERRAREAAEAAAAQQWQAPANNSGGGWSQPAAQPPAAAPAASNGGGGGYPGRARAEALVRQYTGLPVFWDSHLCSDPIQICGHVIKDSRGPITGVHLAPTTRDDLWLTENGRYVIMHEIGHALIESQHTRLRQAGWTNTDIWGSSMVDEYAADCYAARFTSVPPTYGCTAEGARYLADSGV